MKVSISNWDRTNRQKIVVHIDKWDTWNMDSTLARIILPMLLQLQETKHGIPAEFVDVGGSPGDKQYCFDFYSESSDWAFEQGAKLWDQTLDKIIWSFQQIAYSNYEELYHRNGPGDYEFVPIDDTTVNPITGKVEKLFEMVDRNKNHWFDSEGLAEHIRRIDEGLLLFGRWYRSLWD